MGLLLYDFKCPNGHKREALVKENVRVVLCQQCSQMAHRLIPAPRAMLDGCSGDFPTAADKWEKRRASHMAKERKNLKNHGTYE